MSFLRPLDAWKISKKIHFYAPSKGLETGQPQATLDLVPRQLYSSAPHDMSSDDLLEQADQAESFRLLDRWQDKGTMGLFGDKVVW